MTITTLTMMGAGPIAKAAHHESVTTVASGKRGRGEEHDMTQPTCEYERETTDDSVTFLPSSCFAHHRHLFFLVIFSIGGWTGSFSFFLHSTSSSGGHNSDHRLIDRSIG
jgi:hypothetical protein